MTNIEDLKQHCKIEKINLNNEIKLNQLTLFYGILVENGYIIEPTLYMINNRRGLNKGILLFNVIELFNLIKDNLNNFNEIIENYNIIKDVYNSILIYNVTDHYKIVNLDFNYLQNNDLVSILIINTSDNLNDNEDNIHIPIDENDDFNELNNDNNDELSTSSIY
ncbi:hypothetical protein ABK040_003370 [Willaertia magna]